MLNKYYSWLCFLKISQFRDLPFCPIHCGRPPRWCITAASALDLTWNATRWPNAIVQVGHWQQPVKEQEARSLDKEPAELTRGWNLVKEEKQKPETPTETKKTATSKAMRTCRKQETDRMWKPVAVGRWREVTAHTHAKTWQRRMSCPWLDSSLTQKNISFK